MAARTRFLWTDETEAKVLELWDDEAMDWPDIARAIGGTVTADACRTRYALLRSQARMRDGQPLPSRKVSNSLAIDAAKRDAARSDRDADALARGHCTPAFFGDPPPGYSALDQKRAGA